MIIATRMIASTISAMKLNVSLITGSYLLPTLSFTDSAVSAPCVVLVLPPLPFACAAAVKHPCEVVAAEQLTMYIAFHPNSFIADTI